MKVLLVNPPSRFWLFPPLGLGYVAAVLKREGYTVQVLDMTAEPERKLSSVLRLFEPDIVGLSCTSQTFQSALVVAKEVKLFNREIQIVFGGSHPSSMPIETLKHVEIDAVICGEGEQGFLDYLVNPFSSSRLIEGKKMDVNSIPFPARELLPMGKYETAGSILTSRGCPYHCNYCVHHVSGYKWRGRNPESVLVELEELKTVYGIRDIHVVDDNFSFDLKRAKTIFRLIIERNLVLRFYFFNGLRADRVDAELIDLMRLAGVQLVSFGLESSDVEVRQNIRKGVSLEQTAEALKLVHSAGIRTRVSVMIGNAGDTFKKCLRTINWVKSNGDIDEAEFCLATAYPNTSLFDWVKTHGVMLGDPENQSTYFLDEGKPSFETSEFSSDERVKVLRLAQAMVYHKTALQNKSIRNFKIKNIPVYVQTAKMLLLHKSPSTKFRNDKK